jgi:nitronate monooxygenase
MPKAAEAGVDGLIAVAAGAGGHAGTWSPFALVAEIRQFFDKTLLLAGCLNHGHEILAAQLLGADLAYMGTRFIATESQAQDAYKQMLLGAHCRRHHPHPAVSGIPASFLRQSLEQAGYDMARSPAAMRPASSSRWTRKPRPGRPSGPQARASARSTTCPAPQN